MERWAGLRGRRSGGSGAVGGKQASKKEEEEAEADEDEEEEEDEDADQQERGGGEDRARSEGLT